MTYSERQEGESILHALEARQRKLHTLPPEMPCEASLKLREQRGEIMEQMKS